MDEIVIYILIGVIGLIGIGALVWAFFLDQRLKEMQEFFDVVLSGKKVKNLEGIIMEISKKSDKLDNDIEDLFAALNQINKTSKKGLNRVGIVKYNPFGESGRKDCFSVALMNNNKKGILLSSLATENGTKLFLKEIDNGESQSPLTQEEKEATRLALE